MELKLEDLKRVNVQPGDRFVIHTADCLPRSLVQRVQDIAGISLGVPPDHVLVLDGGLTLAAVLGPEPQLKAEAPVVPVKEAGPVVAGGQSLVAAFLHAKGLDGGVSGAAGEQVLRDFVAFAADQLKARVKGPAAMDVVCEGTGPGLRLVDPAE